MFCPGCGLEELQSNQFCRSCGTDMRVVRTAMSSPDSVTASAASARDEIGRAIAAKIRETRSADELAKVTEEVLPEIEKFLESPEEKRLRRLRTGTIISSIGIGVAIALSILSVFGGKEEEFLFLAGLGLVTFFIGIGFILNGVFLTVPKHSLPERNHHFEPDSLPSQQPQGFLEMPARADTNDLFPSVTEHTTKHLKKEL
jgi:hypothetical protein